VVVEEGCPDAVEGRSKTTGFASIGRGSGQDGNVPSSNESSGSTESRMESIARCARNAVGECLLCGDQSDRSVMWK